MADSTAPTNNLQITKDRVKSWAACSDGYRWFLGKFPEGAEFVPVYRALISDKRGGDADWLVGKLFDELDTTTRVKQTAIIAGADAVAIAAQVAAGAEAATTGYCANAATTGKHSVAAALGIDAKAKASAGGAIVMTHRNDDGDLICIRAAMVGQDGIKPDVWYELSADGEFVECEV